MPPIDSSIAMGVKPLQLESPLNMMSQVMQVQGAQNQNAMAQYGLSKAKRMDDQQSALMSALQGGGIDLSTPEGQMKAISIAPDVAAPIIKASTEAQLARSTIDMQGAHGREFDATATDKALGQYRNQVSGLVDKPSAAAWVSQQYSDPRTAKIMQSLGPLDQALQRIPDPAQDPKGFETWKQQSGLGMTEYIKQNKPQIHVQNLGGTSNIVSTQGLGGAPTTLSSTPITQSADNAATNATHITTTGMTNATSLATNKANIAKDLQVAGIQPGGGLDDNAERTAQAIANGQLPAPTGMALLNPKNQRILGRVMEINPQYDATTVSAKKAAATSFASGPLGNALRSVSTANAHLDQLGELADAMQNGNMQVINKVGNYFATQTGSPNATNFDAIKNIVGQEVVKAIVAGGGGVSERDEAAKAFSAANSPAQLKGAIQHYRMVMGAQAANLMEQRRAAGLPNSTLPDYSKTNAGGAPAAPAGWKIEKVN